MHRTSPFALALFSALVVAGCGGGEVEDAAAETPAAEPATTVALEGCFLRGSTAEEAQSRPSPHTELGFVYGDAAGMLCYGAPSAKGRDVMGSLVPYGELWRAGANEATAIHLTAAATVGGVALEPGSYSLYTMPADGPWQVFINSNFERWGVPISDEVRTTDVGSFTVTPEATEDFVETLTYSFEGGEIVMEWENTRLRIPFAAS